MTKLEIQVLRWVGERKHAKIDASIYADAIRGLMAQGLLRLGGTLQNATLELTERGARAFLGGDWQSIKCPGCGQSRPEGVRCATSGCSTNKTTRKIET